MSFDVKEPVDTVFTANDKVADIARISKSQLLDQQKWTWDILYLKKAKPFQSSLLKWDIKPTNEKKTWNKFKIFFCQVQVVLCESGNLNVEDIINHSALVNMVSEGAK